MEFATRFNPKECEDRIYRMWEAEGYLTADASSSKPPFVIVIPPPNITGRLHLGHALNNTIQDILIRWKRMDGYEALYLPGTDHAGIATQAVVEKDLAREGKTRWDLGREEFLRRVWEWKEKYGSTILYQLRRLACSCDWSRTRFTMDEGYSRAVKTVFVSLFKKKLLYRGQYIINWCPKCQTALSDLEVERRDEEGGLWTFRYPLKEGGHISVSTTRPETILGDTAVAVNPKDKRYKDVVGKTAVLPILNREIPVVADDYVDPEFGTGAVKITPAHDVNDFDVAKRHKLPAIQIMDEAGKMNSNAGPFSGQDRFECRKKIVAEFEKLGLSDGKKEYKVVLGRCYRCKTVVEPYLSEQWFVRMKELAKPAVEAVRSGKVRFRPERWSKLYFDWMENIRDWCVSRQIWWGHRIPVWYCSCGEVIAAVDDPTECTACGKKELRQDEDVLDTWFSSALWPFATLGWPEETEDLEKFYPTQVLVTGRDIINLWVARMITSGLEFRGENPFRDVVIHATLMDDAGLRQSKSKGTGVDPLDLLDKYGADALRFALAWLSTGTQDIRFGDKLSIQRVEMSRKFATKLWNASRYVAQKMEAVKPGDPGDAVADRWILSRLGTTIGKVSSALEGYNFGDAAQALYSFVWDDFCDWYIELSKGRADDPGAVGTLSTVLVDILKLLHPIMPFVTEEIWSKLGREGSVMVSSWPAARKSEPELEERMELKFNLIRGVRAIRNRNGISPKQELTLHVATRDAETAEILKDGADIIRTQARIDGFHVGTDVKKPAGALSIVHERFTAYVPLDQKKLSAEVARMRRDIEKSEGFLKKKKAQLANSKFREAKPDMAKKVEAESVELESKLQTLKQHFCELEEALENETR